MKEYMTLISGNITQEEYDRLVKDARDSKTIDIVFHIDDNTTVTYKDIDRDWIRVNERAIF